MITGLMFRTSQSNTQNLNQWEWNYILTLLRPQRKFIKMLLIIRVREKIFISNFLMQMIYLRQKSKDNTKENRNGDRKKKIWTTNITKIIKAWVKSMLIQNRECTMNMKTQEPLLLLTERMLDRHSLISIMICKENFKKNMRIWDLN